LLLRAERSEIRVRLESPPALMTQDIPITVVIGRTIPSK
jgi:hypothetical protein